MKVFWDTSAVLALVLKDRHGRAAAGAAAQKDMEHIATPFVLLEAENRLHAMKLEGLVSPGTGEQSLLAIERIFANRLIRAVDVKQMRLVAAEGQRMIRHFSAARPHKTMDLLHVASARLLRAEGFFTFDSNQSALAKAAGFEIIAP